MVRTRASSQRLDMSATMQPCHSCLALLQYVLWLRGLNLETAYPYLSQQTPTCAKFMPASSYTLSSLSGNICSTCNAIYTCPTDKTGATDVPGEGSAFVLLPGLLRRVGLESRSIKFLFGLAGLGRLSLASLSCECELCQVLASLRAKRIRSGLTALSLHAGSHKERMCQIETEAPFS